MSLRESLDLIRTVKPEAGQIALQHEIEAERASSLSTAEKRVISALADLSGAAAENRPQRLHIAQQAVWAYFVQRELIGFRRHADVIRDLKIPLAVVNGLGAAPPPGLKRGV